MKGEGRLGEAEMSLIYVLQCCLQIRMGSFNMSAALFPHNFKGNGWKGLDREGESLGEDVWFWFFVGVFFFLLTKHIHFEPLPMLDSFPPSPPPPSPSPTL